MKPVRRVCLAYSGGLDTSVILKWLIERHRCEVVAFCLDVGQEEVPVDRAQLERDGASQEEHAPPRVGRRPVDADQPPEVACEA